jgi:hypothetical protein
VERIIKRKIRDIRSTNPPQDVLDYCLAQLNAAQEIVTELKTPKLRDTVVDIDRQTRHNLHMPSKAA